ncbi:MAG: hypothetical protein HFJ60_01605 [Clostridia bacterium]|jgi:hypothetical protein|nr:hypothetical protein [Clostridia bacterium]
MKVNLKDKMKQLLDTKQFNIIIVVFIIFSILFTASVVSLKYVVEGENDLPFNISKISVISTIEGTDIEDEKNKWNLEISQNNDIYLYIKRNNDYKETEVIDSIRLDNFNIEKYSNIGEIKLYKTDNNKENIIFKNISDNEVQSIQYIGDLESNIKEQKISNQGGLVVFRYSVEDIGNYISNEDEEINHDNLLNKLSISNDDLKFKVSFDILVNLSSKKSYKSNVSLEFPVDDVVNKGTQSKEYENLNDIVFKRM